MRLLTMEVENVFSYRHAVIDLSNLSYCSVTGPNGMGKSAIFQAMRWILFGPKALRVPGDHDSVINDEARSASGKLIVESQGHRWLIVRERVKRKSGTVRLAVEVEGQWRSYADKLNATAEAQIRQIVGMSLDVFDSVAYIDQSRSDGASRLINATSTERREILQSLLPELAVWTDIEAAATKELSELRAQLERLAILSSAAEENLTQVRGRLDALQGIAGDADGAVQDDLMDDFDDFADEDPDDSAQDEDGYEGWSEEDLRLEAAQVAQAIEAASASLGELGGARAALIAERDAAEARAERAQANLAREHRDLLRERRDLVAALTAVRNDLERRDLIQSDLLPRARAEVAAQRQSAEQRETERAERASTRERLDARRTDLFSSRQRARDVLEDLRARRESLRSQHREDGECWVCQAKLDPIRYDDLLTDLIEQIQTEDEREQDLSERLDNVKDKLADLSEDEAEARRQEAAGSRSSERATRQVQDLQDELDSTPPAAPEMSEEEIDALIEAKEAEIEREEQAWSAASEDFEDRLSGLRDDSTRRTLGEKIASLRTARDQIEQQLEHIAQQEALRAELQDQHDQARRAVNDLRKQTTPLLERVKRLEFLQGAAGPRGVPTMLMDSFLASLEDHQNRLLAALSGITATGIPPSVEYRTTRDLRSKEGKKDVLDIVVHTPQGTSRLVESFSFGERARLMIAQVFALVTILNERHPGLVTAMVLDEPMAPLDDTGVPAFVELLRAAMTQGVVESIYIMTHDQRVIDALPQRIAISHTIEEGSRIHVHR